MCRQEERHGQGILWHPAFRHPSEGWDEAKGTAWYRFKVMTEVEERLQEVKQHIHASSKNTV